MKRRCDFDLLRTLSMFGVIYLHTASGALRNLEHVFLWEFSNILVDFATPAVPLFFMMSGALLLRSPSSASLQHLFRKRIPKVLLPFLSWSTVVLLSRALLNSPEAAWEGFRCIFNTPVMVPYWFLYALIPMYLLLPLLKPMTDSLSETQWRYLLGLWLVFTVFLHTVRSFTTEPLTTFLTEHWTLNINFIGGYFGYFFLGAYLDRQKRLPSPGILWTTAAVAFTTIVVGTRWDTFTHGAYSDRFTDYLSIFTVVLSTSMFLLAKTYLQGRTTGKLLSWLAGISFPVYLIHPLAIGMEQHIWTWMTKGADVTRIWQQVIFYGMIVAICLVSATVLSYIPLLDRLFTGQSRKKKP